MANTASGVANTASGVANTVPGVANTVPGVAHTVPGVANTASGVANTASGAANTVPGAANTARAVVRAVLGHVMQPSDTPARTAGGLAWMAGRALGTSLTPALRHAATPAGS